MVDTPPIHTSTHIEPSSPEEKARIEKERQESAVKAAKQATRDDVHRSQG